MAKPLTVDVGSLRKRLVIQALPANQAADPNWNEPTYGDWADQATVWGEIKPASGRELVFAGAIVSDATHVITVRYYQGLTTRMRFKYVDDVTGATRYFNVENVNDVEERHVYLTCLCHESQ